jgi:hypothetical protein
MQVNKDVLAHQVAGSMEMLNAYVLATSVVKQVIETNPGINLLQNLSTTEVMLNTIGVCVGVGAFLTLICDGASRILNQKSVVSLFSEDSA